MRLDLVSFLWLPGIVVGLLLLNEGAKIVTDVAATLARHRGHSDFVIGVLLVSALAAMPEILVTLFSIASGSPELGLGNAVGSLIVNLSFMLGLAAFSAPLLVSRQVVLRDFVFLVTVTFVGVAFLADGELTRSEGFALILFFIPYALNLLIAERTVSQAELAHRLKDLNVELELIGRFSDRFAIVRASPKWLFVGFALMFGAAEVVTRGGVALGDLAGVSQFVVGITIIAVGTSLPDIAASFQAAKRDHADLAVAVAVGANLFTLLLNVGLLGLLAPSRFPLGTVLVTGVFVGVQTVLVLWFVLSRGRITRREGLVLLAIYPLYVATVLAIGAFHVRF